MNTHTPGPWCAMYDGMTIRGFDGSDIATVTTPSPLQGDEPKRRANARHIVTACNAHADLLAALQATLDLLTDGDAEPSDADRVTAIVRNAIARATGAV